MISWSLLSKTFMCELKKKTNPRTERPVLFVIPFNPYLKYNYNCVVWSGYNLFSLLKNKRLEPVLVCYHATKVKIKNH